MRAESSLLGLCLAISSGVPSGILYEHPFVSRTVSIAIMMWLYFSFETFQQNNGMFRLP